MIKIILIYLAAVNLAAFIVYGWDKRLAVRERYRFFSFGDAMLII